MCLAQFLEDARQTDALSSLWGSTYCSVFHSLPPPCSLLDLFSSSALACTPCFHSCTRLRTRPFPPPLLAALHVSAEWHRLLSIICSFLLALPLHHSLTGLSQFQCSAHREAPGNRSSRPHHELFMNRCLFSASIGECRFQTSDSLRGWGVGRGGGCIIGLQQRIGPPGQTSSHSYPITLIYFLQYFFKDIFVKLKDNAGDIVPFIFFNFFFYCQQKKQLRIN